MAETGFGKQVIDVVGVSKHFSVRRRGHKPKILRAVEGVSFTLHRGETLAIVGESGSGKSTLARTLMRLIEPTTGAVFLKGENIVDLSPKEMRRARRHIQMIFQDPYASLHPRQTVAEIISDPWKVHKGFVERSVFAEQVAQLLVQVGLTPTYASSYPGRLSGGERQRVAIARALALKPDVLVLDEPVSALDVSIQAQVIKLLMQLQQDLGMAYIFISHDLSLVKLVADQVAVMYMGRFVEQGSAADIFDTPLHAYTQALLNAASGKQSAGQGGTLLSDTVSPLDTPSGCAFRSRCPKAQNLCSEQVPELAQVSREGQLVACHFAGVQDQ